MIIAALDFGSAAICNTDYLEVYDAFLSGGSGDGGGSTASRRLITRYCGNVSRQILVFEYQILHSRFETLSIIWPLYCCILQRGGIYYFFCSLPWFLKIKVLKNQGLLQTLEKFQVLQFFFSVCHPYFFQIYSINLAFFSRWRPRKKIQVSRTWIFSEVWNRPWFLKT